MQPFIHKRCASAIMKTHHFSVWPLCWDSGTLGQCCETFRAALKNIMHSNPYVWLSFETEAEITGEDECCPMSLMSGFIIQETSIFLLMHSWLIYGEYKEKPDSEKLLKWPFLSFFCNTKSLLSCPVCVFMFSSSKAINHCTWNETHAALKAFFHLTFSPTVDEWLVHIINHARHTVENYSIIRLNVNPLIIQMPIAEM